MSKAEEYILMHEAGLSYSQIAAQVGVTKNVVMGAVFRFKNPKYRPASAQPDEKFYQGRPCKKCRKTERYASSQNCVACVRLKAKS